MATMAVEPLLLLANADAWLTASLESVLTQGGYRVISTARRQGVLELARRHRPDGILLDMGLEQRTSSDAFTLCRALRSDPTISRATPIILMTAGPALRAQQVDALRAGAWELRGDPLDTEELVLRLGAYVQGKLEVERLSAEGLLDRSSGLYNESGMTRRSAELAAFTARQGLPLACAVFQPANGGLSTGAADRLALAFRNAGRISDVVCRSGPAEFTVFAPATDETGAEGLVQRISDAVARAAAVKVRAGISTAGAQPRPARPSLPPTPQVSPADLLDRARAALR
jgi:DNA-binding response OmpR family regulator